MNQRPKFEIEENFKVIRGIFDKIYILISGGLWIFSTLWDIYRLQRYWLDYTVEVYSCFFVFYMMVFSINKKLLPSNIYKSFRLITTIRGRGTLLIIISSLFLRDKHAFHKLCSIIFFIGGIVYFICEILVPTTKEELEEIELLYNNKNSDIKTNNNINFDTNKSINVLDKTDAVLNNIKNVQNDINLTKEPSKDDRQKSTHVMIEEDNKEQEESKSNENKTSENKVSEENVEKKTDNPYDIPEDF